MDSITSDDIWGISIEEWLYMHKISEINCDLKMLKKNLNKVVWEENNKNIVLINTIKHKVEEKENLLERTKQWWKQRGKSLKKLQAE